MTSKHCIELNLKANRLLVEANTEDVTISTIWHQLVSVGCRWADSRFRRPSAIQEHVTELSSYRFHASCTPNMEVMHGFCQLLVLKYKDYRHHQELFTPSGRPSDRNTVQSSESEGGRRLHAVTVENRNQTFTWEREEEFTHNTSLTNRFHSSSDGGTWQKHQQINVTDLSSSREAWQIFSWGLLKAWESSV